MAGSIGSGNNQNLPGLGGPSTTQPGTIGTPVGTGVWNPGPVSGLRPPVNVAPPVPVSWARRNLYGPPISGGGIGTTVGSDNVAPPVPVPWARRNLYGPPVSGGGIGTTAQDGVVHTPDGGTIETEGATQLQGVAPSARMAANKKTGRRGARLNDMTIASGGKAHGNPAQYGANGRWTPTGPDTDNAGNAISGGVGNPGWVAYRNDAMRLLDQHQETDPQAWTYLNEAWSANHSPEGYNAAMAKLGPKYRARFDQFMAKYGLDPSKLR